MYLNMDLVRVGIGLWVEACCLEEVPEAESCPLGVPDGPAGPSQTPNLLRPAHLRPPVPPALDRGRDGNAREFLEGGEVKGGGFRDSETLYLQLVRPRVHGRDREMVPDVEKLTADNAERRIR